MSGCTNADAGRVAVAVLSLMVLVGVMSIVVGDVEVGLSALLAVAGTVTVAIRRS